MAEVTVEREDLKALIAAHDRAKESTEQIVTVGKKRQTSQPSFRSAAGGGAAGGGELRMPAVKGISLARRRPPTAAVMEDPMMVDPIMAAPAAGRGLKAARAKLAARK